MRVVKPKCIKYPRSFVTSIEIENICVFHAKNGAPEGIIFVKVVMLREIKKFKMSVRNVKSGLYATGRLDVAFAAWKTNVANAK